MSVKESPYVEEEEDVMVHLSVRDIKPAKEEVRILKLVLSVDDRSNKETCSTSVHSWSGTGKCGRMKICSGARQHAPTIEVILGENNPSWKSLGGDAARMMAPEIIENERVEEFNPRSVRAKKKSFTPRYAPGEDYLCPNFS